MTNSGAPTVFDEESCRYFLREVGERVVPAYPFDYGMEEVYSLILEKYGYDGVADATSVLQDLLEDDDVATGIGDDGDIWRSWRHHWRRRNSDGLNPYIPRIGLFVLPSPTPKSLRRIKAGNFLRQSERSDLNAQPTEDGRDRSRDGSSGGASLPDSAMQLQPAVYSVNGNSGSSTTRTTYSHQRCRLGLPHFDESIRDSQTAGLLEKQSQSPAPSTKSITDSRSEAAETTKSVPGKEVDSSLLDLFERLQRIGSFPSPATEAEDSATGTCSAPQVESPSPQSVRGHYLWPSPLSPRSQLNNTSALPGVEDVEVPQKRPRYSRLSCTGDRSTEEDLSFNIKNTVERRKSNESSNPRLSVLSRSTKTRGTPEPQRKAANRNASLVDGVFRSRANCDDNGDETINDDDKVAKRSSMLSNLMSRQPQSRRRSFLQGVKSLFGATKGRYPNVLAKHRHTFSAGDQNTFTSRNQQHTRTRSNASAVSPMPHRNFGLMLDGAFDDSTLVSSPGSYFNKPLPLTPSEIVRSLSSRTRSNSYSHTFSNHQDPSTASTASTRISKASSREEFQALTKDLVKSGNMAPFELSPVHEVDSRYRRQHFDAPKPTTGPTSPISFTTISRRNPFTDDPVPITPGVRTPNPLQSHPVPHNRFSSGLPSSQSEPNLAYRNTSPPPPVPLFYNAQGQLQSPPSSSPEPPEGKRGEPRGRSHVREGSEDVNSTPEGLRTPKKSVKRSQSPVKRILGLVKNTPKGELQTSTSSPEKTATPNSSSKRSLKQWTSKMRHGFLTADHEEEYREAQMEKYLEEASTPPRRSEGPSTFPISLDPAHQARLQADMELMIVVSANRFLLREAEAGRVTPSTVADTRRKWEKKNLPQVLEYLYDQNTQRELIMANFQTLNFYGSVGRNPVGLNSTMHNWAVLAREMGIRTFCAGDSVVRKWLNDARRVLEMLGAPLITFLAFQDLEAKTIVRITQKQHQRAEREAVNGHNRSGSGSCQIGPVPRRDWSATSNYGLHHRRNMSDGSHKYNHLPAGLEHLNLSPTPSPRNSNSVNSRKPNGDPGPAVTNSYSSHGSSPRDPYDNSRGGRLGHMVQQQTPRATHEHQRMQHTLTPTPTPPPLPALPHRMVATAPTSAARRRHDVEGEVSLKNGLWSDRR